MLFRVEGKIELDQEKIFRRMKVTDAMKPVMTQYYITLHKQIRESAAIEAIYLIEEDQMSLGIAELDACSKKAYCYVNIGSEVVDILKGYFDAKQYILGYLMNEMLGETIMQISSQVRSDLAGRMADGENMTVRYSPGEKEFPLNNQVKIFNKLQEKAEIAGEVNDSYMIVPDKAMMFVYGIGRHLPYTEVDHECTRCTGNRLCPYRTGY